MRVLKDPDVRRAEILDAAAHLFATKGYAKTTISDILGAIGIAKGTFYYYFKSKEEVMDAVIDRVVATDVERARELAAQSSLSPVEKLFRILKAQQPQRSDSKDKLLEQFHQPGNAAMHQRSLTLGIRGLAPVLTGIVEEGVRQGVFSTPFPAEVVEILLTCGQILFDEGLFQWSAEERLSRARALAHVMELSLGAQAGSCSFMIELLVQP